MLVPDRSNNGDPRTPRTTPYSSTLACAPARLSLEDLLLVIPHMRKQLLVLVLQKPPVTIDLPNRFLKIAHKRQERRRHKHRVASYFPAGRNVAYRPIFSSRSHLFEVFVQRLRSVFEILVAGYFVSIQDGRQSGEQ